MKDGAWNAASRRVFAFLRDARISERPDRIRLYQWFFQDDAITSTNDLSTDQLRAFGDTLFYWQSIGELESRCREYAQAGGG